MEGHGPAAPSAPPRPRRTQRFEAALGVETVDRKALAELAWCGVPAELSRCEVWQLLLGYRPLTRERRSDALARKREEYWELRRTLYEASRAVAAAAPAGSGEPPARGHTGRDSEDVLLRQIRKDLPRTKLRAGPSEALSAVVRDERVQGLMERVLFVWAVRQPACSYVQGLNDVLLPLLLVLLADRRARPEGTADVALLAVLGEEELAEVEADCYWCVTKILSEIFDHYTHGQPGIQRMGHRLSEVIRRIDAPLARHLESQGVDLLHTAFRWTTCLMVRELPLGCCVRLWDTLIAESALASGTQRGAAGDDCGSPGFEALLVYFCACLAVYFSPRLREMDFEVMTLFLQKLPTGGFGEHEVEVLLGEAYVLKQLFQESPSHLQPEGAVGSGLPRPGA
ncbi:unnamed protein product [Prorocentrum cordatum]|uniref:Rab-GAP TBC domain-containing protein n=1 Tax=Prorocentrum cordatum TaxID=2364126 RepID=A0ABN9WDK6_9DINO|nr:unnamed protein product [Polarella glacialis]